MFSLSNSSQERPASLCCFSYKAFCSDMARLIAYSQSWLVKLFPILDVGSYWINIFLRRCNSPSNFPISVASFCILESSSESCFALSCAYSFSALFWSSLAFNILSREPYNSSSNRNSSFAYLRSLFAFRAASICDFNWLILACASSSSLSAIRCNLCASVIRCISDCFSARARFISDILVSSLLSSVILLLALIFSSIASCFAEAWVISFCKSRSLCISASLCRISAFIFSWFWDSPPVSLVVVTRILSS